MSLITRAFGLNSLPFFRVFRVFRGFILEGRAMLVGQQIGPFTVEKELGSGAMGSVYRATYTKTGQRVAIKVMVPGLGSSPRALARFEREGEILKQLRHPNIVRLYATGKYHGTPFYAMEYIQGESLDRVMARRGRITWEELVDLGKQLCSALQHAHERGIIHRDLKPSNLMVLPDGTIKLTDFGIAKDLDVTQLTSANCTVGTASYMSPEQCRGERDLTHKSDLYSLGVLFYELITGRKPFIAETPMDMFLLHVQGTCERPSRLVLDIPVWLDTLICQLLEKKPDQRPLDAATVAQALDRIQEKVETLQSAGVDAVRTRAVDRPRDRARLDEEDKEAARTLLGKKRKGKRRRSSIPFHQTVWFKAVAYSALLAGLGFVLYLVFFKPPNPDSLFLKAKELMASNDPQDWDEAREGPIETYLKKYRDQEGAQADQVRAWADQVDLYNRERRLMLWLRRGADLDRKYEQTAAAAVEKENRGSLEEAWKDWEELLKYKDSRDAELHSYALLADKRRRGIQAVYDREAELGKEIARARKQLRPFEPKEGVEGQAALTVYYETFGDVWMARDRWKSLRQKDEPDIKYEKDSKKRLWFLLAAKNERQLAGRATGDGHKGRLNLVRKKLKEAEGLAEKKADEAKRIYQDILNLYGQHADAELAKVVKEARGRLRALKKAS
jgi:serine/threonine-protein kinase